MTDSDESTPCIYSDFSVQLRLATGAVEDDRPLVNFLYMLMRDHLPVGTVTKILVDANHDRSMVFSNGYLAEYAQHIVDMLTIHPCPCCCRSEPNEETLEAIRELEEGGGKRYATVEEMCEDMGIES